jgi:DNA invertase Pin-like site-specific DNA recombinase
MKPKPGADGEPAGGRVFSYVRVSSRAQDREGADGLQRQEQMARDWCQANGRQLDPLDLGLVDTGVSAFRGKNLAAGGPLGQFLAMASSGQLGANPVLLIEDLDRFSRAAAIDVIPTVVRDVAAAGVTLISLRDGLTVSRATLQDDPSTWYRLLGAVQAAHDYSRRLSDRIKSARAAERDAIRRGEPKRTGRLPFWINWDPDAGAFTLDPEWSAVVRRIFDLCIDGNWGGTRIAAQLNSEGNRAKSGAAWSVRSVINLLTERACIGEYQPHRRTFVEMVDALGRTTRRRVDEPLGPPIQRYPGVVEAGRFALAQERIAGRAHKGGPRSLFRCPLQGLANCARCGALLTMTHSRRGDRSYSYLRCQNAIGGHATCDLPPIRHLDGLAAVLTGMGEASWSAVLPGGSGGSELDQARQQLIELQAGLEELQARHRTLVAKVAEAAVADGALSLLKTLQDAADDAAQLVQERQATIQKHQGRLEEMEQQPSPNDAIQDLLETVGGVLAHFGQGKDDAAVRLDLNDRLTRAGLTVLLDGEGQKVGYRVRGSAPAWVSYDADAAVVAMANGQIDATRFPSVMAEHRAIAADVLPLVERAAQQRREGATAAGLDPVRVNAAGQEISDEQAAAGLAWLKSKMARATSYDLAAEAQAVRDHVSRQKALRVNPED